MKKYRISKWSENAEEVEIEKETKDFVIFKNGRRDKKVTDYSSYFDTEIECYNFVVSVQEREVEKAEESLSYYKENLKKAIKLREQFIKRVK